MASNLKFSLILFFLFPLLIGCEDSSMEGADKDENNCITVKKLKGERKNLNINIFLDLSDRISPTFNPNVSMEYWKRDLGYLKAISSSFENHLRNKKIVLMQDRIKLFLHPEPESIDKLDTVLQELEKSFSRENATLSKICSITEDYEYFTNLIYTSTLEKKEPDATQGNDTYPGSDIYDFFKSKVSDYCIKEGYRNILFVLTDGYMYMSGSNRKDNNNKSNYLLSSSLQKWGFSQNNYLSKIEKEGYGFNAIPINLGNLEVFLIGIAPKKSWEIDVLNSYWTNWLREMGVKNFQSKNPTKYIKQADLPSEVDDMIEKFIYE